MDGAVRAWPGRLDRHCDGGDNSTSQLFSFIKGTTIDVGEGISTAQALKARIDVFCPRRSRRSLCFSFAYKPCSALQHLELQASSSNIFKLRLTQTQERFQPPTIATSLSTMPMHARSHADRLAKLLVAFKRGEPEDECQHVVCANCDAMREPGQVSFFHGREGERIFRF